MVVAAPHLSSRLQAVERMEPMAGQLALLEPLVQQLMAVRAVEVVGRTQAARVALVVRVGLTAVEVAAEQGAPRLGVRVVQAALGLATSGRGKLSPRR